ncbi:MAG: alanyl-tRNA editing protein [Planctomycetes bacterium]|nr:alanyl-tRNA editing protein [Planctomycetota bacterium]
MTERLYYDDPYLTRFEARVVRATPDGVVLDRTAFYPDGGGQPHDTGTLNGVAVVGVREEGDDIVHVVAQPVEGEVSGVVDWERRRDHMQQHHGQHLLSEAFVRVCGAETESFHLGSETSTIELGAAKVAPVDVERAETLANMVVFENRAVESGFFTPEEAKGRPLRKPPPAGGRIRIVHVADFDCSACCGTHPRRTGDVGFVMVVGVEGSRVHFVCGLRGLKYARGNAASVRGAMAKLSCAREDIVASVGRTQEELVAARKRLAAAERALAGYQAKELAAAAPSTGKVRLVERLFEEKDGKFLQVLANGIIEQPGMVAVLGGTGGASSVALARSKDVAIDLRPVLQEALAAIGGKGGGAPHFCQGGGEGKDVGGALRIAREKILANLGA